MHFLRLNEVHECSKPTSLRINIEKIVAVFTNEEGETEVWTDDASEFTVEESEEYIMEQLDEFYEQAE